MVVSFEREFASADSFTVRNKQELLRRLNSPEADIAIMQQDQILDIAASLCDLPTHQKQMIVTREIANKMVADSFQELGIGNAAMANEIDQKVQLFAELFGRNEMELRWEVTERQSCPKFHCDNVFVRMLVTYFGPTTEFINRDQPDVVYRAPSGSIVFLKGHKHPTYQDHILHRSPVFAPGDKRFCVIINFSDQKM